jgi:hypothetical protein
MIHIVGAGTSIITASHSGNSSYIAALSVNQTLLVNKASQTITFPELPVKTTSDTDFSPGATTSSGLGIAYTSSNTAVATIVGDKIHIVGPGTSEITALQNGNSIYNEASNVLKTLTVKSTQTITFPAIPTKTTSSTDFNPEATASSGLPVTYTSSNTSVATVVGGLIHMVGAGTTNITASQPGNSSYTAAPDVVRVLTVNQTTAINYLNTDEFSVYPIPASDKISVKIPENKNVMIQMVSSSGQIVYNCNQTMVLEVIDISTFAKGNYTIKIVVDGQVIIKKIVIQ